MYLAFSSWLLQVRSLLFMLLLLPFSTCIVSVRGSPKADILLLPQKSCIPAFDWGAQNRVLLFVRFLFSRYPLLTCIYYLLIQSYLAIPTLSPPSTPVLVSVSLLYCEVASISIGYILRLELFLAVLIGHDLALYINSQYSTVDQFSSRSVLLAPQTTRTKCQEPRFSTTPRHPKPAKISPATQNL